MKSKLWSILPLPALALSSPVFAQSASIEDGGLSDRSANDSLFGDNRSKDDEGKEFLINGRVSLGGQIEDNFDLDSTVRGNRSVDSPQARLDITWRPDDDVEILVSSEAGVDFEDEVGRNNTSGFFELREAYLLIDDSLAKNVEFQIGRQDFEDKREWLYDERLDGVRLAYDHKAWRVEIGYGREALVPKEIFRRDPGRDKVDNFIFHAEYELTKDWDLSAYVLKQEDRRATNVSPTFFGFQSEGKFTPYIGHWFDFSIQRGRAGTRKLRANAVDAGLIFTVPRGPRPAVFMGFARGSGGGNATTSKDFRQTGLQDNEDRITGLGNVKYYGELLDPDLSNIKVYTLGFGIRPMKGFSLELVGHKYRQVNLDDDNIRGSPVDANLNGLSRDIGKEVDLIAAVRLGKGFGLEAKFGWFSPGKAFDPGPSDDAYFFKARLVYRF